MNYFQTATHRAISTHGIDCTYTRNTTETYDPSTGSVTNTSLSVNVKAYKKHIRATQYNYPNLVGRDSAMFYIYAEDISFVPVANDIITWQSQKYTIDSVQSHEAFGEIILYRLVAVKA
jgi:hypothetical protein